MSNETHAPIAVTADTFTAEVLESPVPVIIDFWAPWCAPCRAITPVLEKQAAAWGGRVKVVKVNVDEEMSLADAFKIRSIPTVAAMRGKEVIDMQIGFAGPQALESLFSRLADEPAAQHVMQ